MGDRFKDAKLLEVSENSYLITTEVRLPVFGKSFQLFQRTKSSISTRGHLLTHKRKEYTTNREDLPLRMIPGDLSVSNDSP